MSKSRRQVLVQRLEKTAVALVLVDLALYFGAFRPLRDLSASEARQERVQRQVVGEWQRKVVDLQKVEGSLPGTDEQIQAFLREHVPPRRRCFSHTARLVNELTQQAKLDLTTPIGYHLESDPEAPLQRLGVDLNVEGSFSGLINFAHALETGSDLVLFRDFTFAPTKGGTITMRLVADLYVKP